ncbi:MAG: peptidoglycan editing factor PgeF [Phycisphaerales bacterium]|nr:peptidoglycan editing factor PgeF [Phycisphaerales bacterium]
MPHGFSTRAGGVSGGPFESLNFGNPAELAAERKDPPENIRANFGRLLAVIGAGGRRVVQVHQVHGAGVRVVRAGEERGPGALPRADAIVTDDAGAMVCIRVADCAPVLMASADGRVVAAVHAGWRGVIEGVGPAAVEAMRGLGAERIVAAIGPCISAAHFEVGPEVVAEFRRVLGAGAPVLEHRDAEAARAGKAFIDLKEALRIQLREAGVAEVEVLPHCTVAEAGLFFSHRRERGVTGRMVGVIGPRG